MRNRHINKNDRIGSSRDFANNEGFHNYEDQVESRGEFRNPPHYADSTRESQRRSGSDFRHASADGGFSYEHSRGSGMDYPTRNSSNLEYGQHSDSRQFSSSPWNSANERSSDRMSRSSQPTGQHFGKGPKGYQRSDDRICEEVCEALSQHADIDASELEVDVKEGVVTLSGTIESRQTKRLVEDSLEGISGVLDIKNNLRILANASSPQTMQNSSSTTADASSTRSAANSTMPRSQTAKPSTTTTSAPAVGKSVQ